MISDIGSGSRSGLYLYTPEHHHGYIDKPDFRFTPRHISGKDNGNTVNIRYRR